MIDIADRSTVLGLGIGEEPTYPLLQHYTPSYPRVCKGKARSNISCDTLIIPCLSTKKHTFALGSTKCKFRADYGSAFPHHLIKESP